MVFLFCEVTVEATHVGHVGHLVFLCLRKIFPLCLLCMHVFADGSCIYFSIVHACMHACIWLACIHKACMEGLRRCYLFRWCDVFLQYHYHA